MTAAVLDHLWQSTLVALGVGLLALAFRKARAAVRHGLWLAASAKFLVPFAALAALGRLLAPAVRPPLGAAPDAALLARAAQPFSQAAPPLGRQATAAYAAHDAARAAIAVDPALVLLGVWALGCAAVLVIWSARWAKVRAAVRGATPAPTPAPMPVLASPSMLEPGLVGLWRPVLLVPETLFDRLSPAEIDALVAHEACHLRRRDNLAAALHMLVEALFWFHPLVWWIGARLIETRERACDEAVVRAGHDRAAYARGLVECCRLYLQSPLACVAGASGSDLTRRVERIMTAPPSAPLSRSARILLLAACLSALASPVAAGWLASPAGRRAAAAALRIADAPPARLVPALAAPRREDRAARLAAAVEVAAAPATAAALGASSASAAPPAGRIEVAVGNDAIAHPVEEAQMKSIGSIGAAVLALAQAAPASATTAAAPAEAPTWVRRPPDEAVGRIYPLAADRDGVTGEAKLRCRIDGSGHLTACKVTGERPEGAGFGAKAIRFARDFRAKTTAPDGGSMQGRFADFTVQFTPRKTFRLVDDGAGKAGLVRWRRLPSAPYPWDARFSDAAGRVVLHCRAKAGGAVDDCRAVSETPEGLGFARMAQLDAEKNVRIAPETEAGAPVAGRMVEVPVVINPACGDLTAREATLSGCGPAHTREPGEPRF
jgi:TonB family protein